MPIRKYWRVNCETDGLLYEYSLNAPTVCPINPTHTIYGVSIINSNESPSPLVQVVVDINGSGNYTSIAEAFSDGNITIFVKNGTYVETSDIIIPDRGKLTGETPGLVIINFMNGASLKIDGSNGVKEITGTISMTNNSKIVTGSGTTFTNLSAGRFILIGNNYYQIGSITNNTSLQLTNKYLGSTQTNQSYVAQQMLTGVTVGNVVIAGSSNSGLLCRAARFSRVHDVAFSKNFANLNIYDSGDCGFSSIATQNCISSSGIYVNNSVDLLFDNCNSYNNFGSGIEVSNGCNNLTFDACSVSCNMVNGYEINTNSSHITITDGTCKQNMSCGVHLDSSVSGVIVNSTTILSNNKGVYSEGNNNVINASNICFNVNGIECIGLISVKGCIFDLNTTNGIDLSGGHDSIIEGNHINNCIKGIVIGGENHIIYANRITSSSVYGLEITVTAENTIVTSNNVKGNIGTNYIDNGIGTIFANNVII